MHAACCPRRHPAFHRDSVSASRGWCWRCPPPRSMPASMPSPSPLPMPTPTSTSTLKMHATNPCMAMAAAASAAPSTLSCSLTWPLANYPMPALQVLGEYIDNLETKQLSLGIWSGDVVLHNLRLKKDALSKLNLPIDVLDGYLGDLTLSIPWSDLKNKPLKVEIKNLHILAMPKASVEYDPVEEEERLQNIKKQKLAAAEEMLLRTKNAGEETFFAQLTTKILDNLQLSISNIHIRYEDPSISTPIPFSVGITLADLSAVSTDENWKEGFVQVEHGCIYKLLRLSHFGIYWATDSVSYAASADKAAVFRDAIVRDTKVAASRQFILNPVSGEGRLTWQKRHDPAKPKTDISLFFDGFAFNLDDEQYASFIALFGSFSRYMKSYPYRRLRPPRSISPKMDPKAWFRYGVKCILSDIHDKNRRWSWEFFKERRDLRLEYIAYYMQHKSGTLDYDGKQELDILERLLSFDDIRLYRHLATSKLKKDLALKASETTAATAASSSSWIGWITGVASQSAASSPQSAATPQAKADEGVFTAADLRQLYDTIEFDPNSVPATELPPDFVMLKVNWKLNSGSFTLRRDAKDSPQDLFCATFQAMAVEFCQHPVAMSTHMTLEKVVVVENVYPNSLHSTLIRAKRSNGSPKADSGSVEPFFRLRYERKPLDGHADDMLAIKMLPLEIVVNPFALRTIFDFFSPQKEELEAISTLQAVARDAIQGVTAQTRASLEFAIEEHHVFDLQVEVDAPIFLVPSNFTDEQAPILVIDAGHLQVESSPISAAVKEQLQEELNAQSANLEKFMYDTYVVKLSSVQILLTRSLDEYQCIIDTGRTANQSVMDKVDVSFTVKNSILPKAYEFPKFKVDGQLPRLHVNFSDYNYNVVTSILDSGAQAFAASPATSIAVSEADISSHQPLSRRESWRHPFAGDASPLPLSESDSKEEFHDAFEELANSPGKEEPMLVMRILSYFTFQCHHVSMAVQTVTTTPSPDGGNGLHFTTRTIAVLAMNGFEVSMTQRSLDTRIKCHLRSISVENSQLTPDAPFHQLIGQSDETGSSDDDSSSLVDIVFHSIQPLSPDFKGVNQTLEVTFNSTQFVVSRDWILDMYKFFSKTFKARQTIASVPSVELLKKGSMASIHPKTPPLPATNTGRPAGASVTFAADLEQPSTPPPPTTSSTFVLLVKSVKMIVVDNNVRIASGLCSSVAIQAQLTGGNTLVKGTLGRLSVIDDLASPDQPLLRNFLLVDEDQTASFEFEMLESQEAQHAGFDSSLKLRAASVRIVYMDEFIGRLYAYFSKFQDMQPLVESARKAAEESAIQMQQRAGRFTFDVILRTPIILWPKMSTLDHVIFYLGEISARNSPMPSPGQGGIALDDEYRIDVESMRMVSVFTEPPVQTLAMIDSVNVGIVISFFKDQLSDLPRKQITMQLSRIALHLTDDQYQLIVDLWRAFNAASSQPSPPPPPPPELAALAAQRSMDATGGGNKKKGVVVATGSSAMASVVTEISIHIPSILLEVFADTTTALLSVEDRTLAQFAGTDTTIKLQLRSDSSMDMEWRFRSLSIYDTRTQKQSFFREIMVPTNETEDQFVLHMYSSPTTTNYGLTIDRPKLIFDLNHIFSIRSFFVRPWLKPASADVVAASASAKGMAHGTSADAESDWAGPPDPDSLTFRVNFIEPEIVLLRDPAVANTDAVVLLTSQLVIAQEQILTMSFLGLGLHFCVMDSQDKSRMRFVENFDVTLSLDSRQTAPSHFLTNATLSFSNLVLRVSYQDMLLLSDLSNRVLDFMNTDAPASPTTDPSADESAESVLVQESAENPVVHRERFRLVVDGVRAVLIDDTNSFHVPIFDLVLGKFVLEVADWSSQLRLDTTLALHANYFNLKNSHWEPFVEQFQFTVSASRQQDESKALALDVFCRKKLELNLSHAFVGSMLMALSGFNSAASRTPSKRRDQYPYVLRNRTGYPIHVWVDAEGSNVDTTISKIENGKDLGWRFEDWRTVRERSNPAPHRICVQLHGPSWETLKNVIVDREGTALYVLRPSINKVTHRVVCEVQLKNQIKIVTFRSATVVRNHTAVPLEVMIVNRRRQTTAGTFRVLAKEDFALPIEASFTDSILVRPFGFGYEWCSQNIYWEDFKADQPASLITCKSMDAATPSFRFQVNVVLNGGQRTDYPNLDIVLLAPYTIENLLPFDMKYIIFDKMTRQECRGDLKRGCADPLHTLDPTHLLALNIQVNGTDFRQKEVVIITNTELQYRDDIIVLYDQAGRQLNLKLKYSEMADGVGRRVKIYSPYVLLNQTGREMFFSARSLVTTSRIVGGQVSKGRKDMTDVEPFMFSYSTFEPLRSRAQIKVDNSEWSKPLSFEAVGSLFQVTVPIPSEQANVHLGVSIKEGEGKYYLTKVVTFSPRFIVQNNLPEALYFRQTDSTAAMMVKSKESMPLLTLKAAENGVFELSIRLSNAMSNWSNGFIITQLGTVFVKIGRIGSSDEDLVRVEVTIENASLFVTFSRQEGRWPLKIDNQSNVDISMWQNNASTRYLIPRQTSLPYAWDHPSEDHKQLVIEVNGKEHKIDTSYLGRQKPFKYPIGGPSRFGLLLIEVVADGPATIVKLKPYMDGNSKKMLKDDTASQSDMGDASRKEAKILHTVQVRMEGIGISVIGRNMQEIAYASAKSLMFMWTDTEDSQAVAFSLKWLQIDNQMYGAVEPIFLYPTVIPVEGKEDNRPVLMLSLCKSKDTSYGVGYYKWFTLLLQELSIDLDEDFLYAITDFMAYDSSAISPGQETPDDKLYDLSRSSVISARRDEGTNLFFERFLLHPVQVNMSFSRIPNAARTQDARAQSAGIMSFVLDVLTMTIGNIHDAPIRLNALELEHPNVSAAQLADLITRFYSQEVLGQVHRIIGAADFLGNPVGLFNNVASGVSDMFYEPLQGFEITRPQDFGIGVARGASSLVKKTVFGVTDTLSKFTGSIGKGLSVITMDDKFQEKRRLANRNRPRHVVYGMTSGAASLIRSFTSGVTGVVSQPIKGAQESGVGGFFMGLGKGIVGAVTKPMIGVVDLATSVSEGIKNTTTVFDSDLDRQRLPRFIGKDKILKPYDQREALGQSWLKSIENGRFFHEHYVAHLEIRIEDLVAIVTESRVLMARIRKLKLDWDMPFEEMQVIRPETGGLTLVGKARHIAQARMVPCPDPSSADVSRGHANGAPDVLHPDPPSARCATQWFRGKVESAFADFLQHN
ncbi:hypothetical protein BC831DRAFT_410850 [Entophlyctis helioformis]|nr:hypothetical protein BC831DRAFT_410850 [Entophlyctis helioformis]